MARKHEMRGIFVNNASGEHIDVVAVPVANTEQDHPTKELQQFSGKTPEEIAKIIGALEVNILPEMPEGSADF